MVICLTSAARDDVAMYDIFSDDLIEQDNFCEMYNDINVKGL